MLVRAALEGMGVATGARRLREGTLAPIFGNHSEVRNSLLADYDLDRKAQARGPGLLGMDPPDGRPQASGQETLRNRHFARAAARKNLARGGASRYLGKATTCRAPAFPATGGTAKGEMTQTEPWQCDSMTGARPSRARRLVG